MFIEYLLGQHVINYSVWGPWVYSNISNFQPWGDLGDSKTQSKSYNFKRNKKNVNQIIWRDRVSWNLKENKDNETHFQVKG